MILIADCSALIALAGAERNHHVQAARTAWESIDRPDLVQQLEEEFGTGDQAGT
jgi:hypothetical protein